MDLPSSSTTSKQSNSQTNIGGSPRNLSGQNGLTNEVRQITLQFNEIVYLLQSIDASISAASVSERTPQISSVIAKMFSMKSAYDQTISNLGRQLSGNKRPPSQRDGARGQLSLTPSRRAEAGEQSMYNKVVKDSVQPFREPLIAAYPGEGTGGSTNLCKHCQGHGQVKSNTSISDQQNPTSHRGTERVVIDLETYNKTGADSERVKTSDSYRKMLAQCQKLTEENKRVQQLTEENATLKEQLAKSESALARSQKSLAQAQS